MERILPRISNRSTTGERWIYGIGGIGLIALGLRRKSWRGGTMALIGADLLSCAATGHHLYELVARDDAHAGVGEGTRIPHQRGVQVEDSVRVEVPAQEAYAFVRRLENLPRFLKHVKRVETRDDKRSHWVVKAPAGTEVEWDAEIINDVPGKLIAWRSVNDPDVDSAGSIHFERAGGNGSTRIRVRMQYLPPAGTLGAGVAKLLGEEPEQQLREDLARLKLALENQSSVEG